jgi:hypothetical protein
VRRQQSWRPRLKILGEVPRGAPQVLAYLASNAAQARGMRARKR